MRVMPTPERAARVFEVLRRRQTDLTVVAEDVYKPHNLSAMLRSCDAVGIPEVHAVRPTGGVPTYDATSASAHRWVDLRVHGSLDAAWDTLRARGMQVLAAHFSDAAVDYRDVDYTRPTAVLFGNERSGVTDAAAARADAHVVIPMLGMVPSLNVSVATAVVLFEAQRQRRAAGAYDRPAMTARARNDQAYAWLYPDDAAARREAGAAFPWLEADGGVRTADGPPVWARDDGADDGGAGDGRAADPA